MVIDVVVVVLTEKSQQYTEPTCHNSYIHKDEKIQMSRPLSRPDSAAHNSFVAHLIPHNPMLIFIGLSVEMMDYDDVLINKFFFCLIPYFTAALNWLTKGGKREEEDDDDEKKNRDQPRHDQEM